ncbi:MAG: peptidoglycan bridge formation glycyltransferase FemA/FemB family protein [Bacteroidetes bacterium]|nr:peptidoglycan bridge formation glycyltransferase FemA/FemB family protein [Bacteroidota bacterium]
MEAIKSLTDKSLNQENFPIFFWDNWLKFSNTATSETKLYYHKGIVVPIIIHKLKFLTKADYVYVPLKHDGTRLNEQEEFHFINKFHDFLKQEKICDVIFPPSHIVNFKVIPKNVLYFQLGIIIWDINQPEELILKKMTKNYQKKIKNALNSGVTTNFGFSELFDFYTLYSETLSRQKLQHTPFIEFENFIKKWANNTLVGVSRMSNIPEASVFIYFDNSFAYADSGGSAALTQLNGSNKLLLYEAILELHKRNIKKVVLGGYRNPNKTDKKHNGIQDYKLRYGAEIKEGYHFIKIINPIKYYLFEFALKIKSILTGKTLSFINTSGLDIKKSR